MIFAAAEPPILYPESLQKMVSSEGRRLKRDGGSRFHGQSDESSKTAQTKAAFVFVGGFCFTCTLLSLAVAATVEEFAAAKLRR